jgi:hypothetical protein
MDITEAQTKGFTSRAVHQAFSAEFYLPSGAIPEQSGALTQAAEAKS